MPPPLRFKQVEASAKLFSECKIGAGFSRRPIASANIGLSSHPQLSSTSFLPSHSYPSCAAASFSTTSCRFKKGAPKAKKTVPTSSAEHIPDNKAQANRDREIDPYNFSDLESKIKHQLDWLRDALQKLRSGGRLSPETIEGFQVEIKHGLGGEGGQGKKVEKMRLGDLATVVPRGGRLIAVMVNEEAVRLYVW
jgi:ribosome recycling factor